MSISSASELELVLLDQASLQLEREGMKKKKMARGMGVVDYSREAIVLNFSVLGGDYSREAINRRTAFIRGLFCLGVMVE